MSVINNNLLMTPEGYQISRSVRMRSSASAYFNRTFGTATNTLIWTWSAWVKRGAFAGNGPYLFEGYTNATNRAGILFTTSENLQFFYLSGGSLIQNLTTTQVFRDPSAWYHIVIAYDATQATASNRTKMYVNGVQVTAFSTATYGSLNQATWVNTNSAPHNIGVSSAASTTYFDGYLTEINFIDGQALTPSSFGETDVLTGVWKPKKYAGTYGTNGFYLNFSDNSNNTATTIGKDYSGNGNNWTPNNISVTAGVTYDSMLDVPTPYADGGNGRGNYAVLNPLTKNTASTVSDGNLAWNCSPGSSGIRSSMALPSSGLIYLEATAGTSSSSGLGMAFGLFTQSVAVGSSYITGVANSWGIYSDASGVIGRNGTNTTGITIITANETYQLAVDLANSRAWLGRNNSWYDSGSGTTGNPSTGANPTFTSLPTDLLVGLWGDNTKTWVVNFGQRPFAYTPPTGFKALNTQNLPDATIKKGNAYFDATTYTGTGSARSVTGLSFQPDLVWVKGRSVAYSHLLTDSVRGVSKRLISDSTAAEVTDTDTLTAFNSDGFSWGTGIGGNQNAATYVAWQWKESATAGFDIVTYTGNGTAGRTVSHNLGVAPAMMIVKNRTNSGYSWGVWHKLIAATEYLLLNSTAAKATGAMWNNTAPSSSVITLGASTWGVNENADTFVAYLFAEVAGFSKFGSYTGNGSTDGPFVFCGFRPRYVLIKRTDTTNDWMIHDTVRDTYNAVSKEVYANLSSAEAVIGDRLDITANGFKLRTTGPAENASGGTYIFAAFAENPFKNALAR